MGKDITIISKGLPKSIKSHRLRYACASIIATLLLCACTHKTPAPSLPQDNVSHHSLDAQIISPQTTSPLDITDMNTFLNADLPHIDFIDMSAYADEQIIEINSHDDAKELIKKYFEYAKSKADPKTGSLDGILLPIHAVLKINSDNEISKINEIYPSLANIVTTFEVQFSGKFIFPNQISFNPREKTRNRIILTGIGDSPVQMGTTHIWARADIFYIKNLAWSGSYLNLLEIDVSKLFLAEKIVINDRTVAQAQEFLAKPAIILNAHSRPDARPTLAFQNCYFSNISTSSILAYKDNKSKLFDKAIFTNVGIIGNTSMNPLFDISVEIQASLHAVIIKDNDNRTPFIIKDANPQLDIEHSTLSNDNIAHR